MKLKPIKTIKDYQFYLDWVDKMFDKQVKPQSADGINLQIVLLLLKSYEDKKFPIPTPDPIEAIKIKMAEKGIKNKDLVDLVGSKGYISAILNRKKPLTLELARIFHRELGVPSDVFIS